MLTQFIKNLASARTILVFFNSRKFSYAYPFLALINYLQENQKDVSVSSFDETSERNILRIAPKINIDFLKDINSKKYILTLKEKSVANIINISKNKVLSLELESDGPEEIKINDFVLSKKQATFDITLFIGDFTSTELTKFSSDKAYQTQYLIPTNDKNLPTNISVLPVKKNIYQLVYEICTSTSIISKKSANYLLAGILHETKNFTNEQTEKYWVLAYKLYSNGVTTRTAHKYLPKISFEETQLLGKILNSINYLCENTLFLDLSKQNIPNYLISETVENIKKIHGLSCAILKTSSKEMSKYQYQIIKLDNTIELRNLQKRYHGIHKQGYCKIITEDTELDIIAVLINSKTTQSPPQSNWVNINDNNIRNEVVLVDPLQQASEIPEPMNFFKKTLKPVVNTAGPLPQAY